MEAYVAYNPTKLIFGKGRLEELKTEVPKYGKKYFSFMEEVALNVMVFMIRR